jgi:hypothetical protein
MKPRAAPSLLAAVTALAPARLVRKLDAAPRVADSWHWQGPTVTTESGECVTLTLDDGVVRQAAQLSCSCLLSPRCFHVLAVAAALEVEESLPDAATAAGPAAAHDVAAGTDAEERPVTEAQRAIAVRALRVLDGWLKVGASGAGAVLQGELLRVAHEARLEGAHRLAGAALRSVRGARALRGEMPDFSSEALVDDLRELALSAYLVSTRPLLEQRALGTARREYEGVGNLRLHGLACEPIVARAGFAGVTSYVCDEQGKVYSLSDILPGDPSRARGAYDVAVVMGDTSLTHRELTRAGLFVQSATASADMRLGAGKQVKAVRATSSESFDRPGPRLLFGAALDAQLDRAFDAWRTDTASRPKGASLLFVQASVLGPAEDGVAVLIEDVPVTLTVADEHPSLPYRDNLRLLAELAGRTLRVLGHVSPQRPRSIAAIAVEAGADALSLPEGMGGRVNLGLDVLTRAQLVTPQRRATVDAAPAASDPLSAVRRRLVALVLSGTRSLPPEAGSRIDAECRQLRAALMPSAASALGTIADACRAGTAGPRLCEGFLALASYEQAATLKLQRATFFAP